MSVNIIWTPERVQKLVELWQAGRSASEVSRAFGEIVSRSAVIGKIHRLGIQRGAKTRHSPRRGNPKAPRTPGPKTFIARSLASPGAVWTRGRFPAQITVDVDIPTPVVDEPAPLAQRKTVETLTNACCRWPVGDPGTAEFHFCGATRIPGLPYCEPHARRAYTPTYYQQKAVGWAGRVREEEKV